MVPGASGFADRFSEVGTILAIRRRMLNDATDSPWLKSGSWRNSTGVHVTIVAFGICLTWWGANITSPETTAGEQQLTAVAAGNTPALVGSTNDGLTDAAPGSVTSSAEVGASSTYASVTPAASSEPAEPVQLSVRKVNYPTFVIEGELVQAWLESPAPLSGGGGSTEPARTKGLNLVIPNVPPPDVRRLFRELGLTGGDEVLALDGWSVALSPEHALNAYAELRRVTDAEHPACISLSVKRKERLLPPRVICVQPRPEVKRAAE